MLERLRAIQNTWIGKSVVAVIMGLIMVSFVIWGIGPVFTGFNANTLASVGADTITVDAFRQAYQTDLQQMQARARRPITNAQAHQYGLDTQVLSRLVSDAVLDNQARSLDLAISQDQIAKAITTDATFAGPDGQFNRDRFLQLLRDNDMTEQGFVHEQRNVYLRQELIQGLIGDLKAPKAALEALHSFEAETRSIDFIMLPSSAAGAIPAPDEPKLQAFFDAHAARYRAPEYRRLVILPLVPAAMAKPDAVSDADIQARYDQVKAKRFTTPETRMLQQIVFPTEAEAQAASAAIKNGKSFATVATERNLTAKDIDIGGVTLDSGYDKSISAAAFALPADGVSDPVKTAFGTALVHVTAIEPGAVKALAEVAPTLRVEIAIGRTGDAIRALHDRIEDARASGQSLTEAAKAAGLAPQTIDAVDANDHDKTGALIDLPDAPALLKAAFASDIGVDNDTVRMPDGGQIFFEVAGIDPARAQTFGEVRSQVEAAWRAEETARLVAAKADDLAKAIASGKTMADAAAAEGNLPIVHVADVKRAGGTGLSATVARDVFATGVGQAGTAPADGEGRIVFKVLGTTVPPLDPDSTQTEQLGTQYQNALADALITTYLAQVQGRIGVKINAAAFAAVTGGS